MFVDEVRTHLTDVIIPFWKKLRDDEQGGYYGLVNFDLSIDKKAVKGCILNSRILWFFSNAYKVLKDESLLDEAKHAYDFMINYCIDKENGGIYWSLNYDKTVCEDIKHTYNQAFAIYALSSYYDISKDKNALDLAYSLYNIIEEKCTDSKGYLEAFDRQFNPVSNEKLSENGVMAEKTMNTLLHVFEAYTELLRVTGDKNVAQKIKNMMNTIENKIYNPKKQRQEVFFDKDWNSLIDLHSYGHDIETAWLIDRGCEILKDDDFTKRMSAITSKLTEKIYNRAYENHSVLNECENGVDNKLRIWWVQAESIVGFLNGYQRDGKKEYLQAAVDIWEYIKEFIIDKRQGSEWYWEVDENGMPTSKKPIVEPWKCPYHNGRMCIEVIRRNIDVA